MSKPRFGVEIGDTITVVIGTRLILAKAVDVDAINVQWKSQSSDDCGTIKTEQWVKAAKAQAAIASAKETGPHDVLEMDKYVEGLKKCSDLCRWVGRLQAMENFYATNVIREAAQDMRKIQQTVFELTGGYVGPEMSE